MARRLVLLGLLVPLLVAGILLGGVYGHAASSRRAAPPLPPPDSQHLKQRFTILSRMHSNRCSLASTDLDKLAVHGRLQGSCCQLMMYSRYVLQIRRLRRYAAVGVIPRDPYDVPVTLAKRLIGYDRQLHLNAGQRRIYGRAARLSHEHGPCCCHCWRWSAFRGQAKELIIRRRFGARAIATIWNLEDGCGGKG